MRQSDTRQSDSGLIMAFVLALFVARPLIGNQSAPSFGVVSAIVRHASGMAPAGWPGSLATGDRQGGAGFRAGRGLHAPCSVVLRSAGVFGATDAASNGAWDWAIPGQDGARGPARTGGDGDRDWAAHGSHGAGLGTGWAGSWGSR